MSVNQKNRFQPIAIVGRGCILPGCQSVDELWRIIEQGRVETSSASEDDWHVDQQRLLSDQAGVYQLDKMWSNHGGYVRGFEDHFDATQFRIDPSLMKKLDPVFLWSMEAARQALAGLSSSADLNTAGVIMGNLSYPTRSHSRFAEEVWMEQMRGKGGPGSDVEIEVDVAAENRFMSGLPAMLVAQGLGLGGDTMALDAACASGLYAIKVACDRLQSRKADVMLAGGVNAADPLFIHMGFCALNALSKSGKSQPFSETADGLVPSDGAAFVALKRLEDARADGDKIYGVIRGIGLSNDGRSGGFLSPSTEGQVACIKQAYQLADIDPAEVQFIECHATGTEAGDSTEITSLSAVFTDASNLPLGSLKGNLGHLITVSGVAGLLKILLAFEHKTIPGTPNATPNLASVASSGFSVPESNTQWSSDGPRLAGISSFGFGGNNAHLLVQEEDDKIHVPDQEAGLADNLAENRGATQFAIVKLAVRTDQVSNADDFGRGLFDEIHNSSSTTESDPGESLDSNHISLNAKNLAFPPNDLKEALGQQLILLDLLPEVQTGIEQIESSRTGIFIGMQTDSEVCRYGLRWRIQDLDPAASTIDLDAEIASSPNASSVIGKMPNVPANRLSNQLNITGPGFTVSREELSGDAALELAMTAIGRGELDAAIVGAVELGNEKVHEVAIAKIAPPGMAPDASAANDAAVLMVVKSVDQALADGDEILAIIEPGNESAPTEVAVTNVDTRAGAHAAAGLLNLAAGIQRVRAGQNSTSDRSSGIKPEPVVVHNQSVFGESSTWCLTSSHSGSRAFAARDQPQMEVYAAPDRETLVANIKVGTMADSVTGGGPCRAALVGASEKFVKLRQRAIQSILASDASENLNAWSLDGISFSESPIQGELASVFTGAASAYPGMGKDLFFGLPGISGQLADEIPESAGAMVAAFDPADERHREPSFQLAGSSYLSQLHARISRDLLGLKPDVAMGLSSGETNSMFAFGAWQDMDSLLQDIDATELYRSALARDFTSVRDTWGLTENEIVDWENYRVLAPVEDVRLAVDAEKYVYLTIVQSDRDCVIGGKRGACDSVLARLGNPETLPLGHDLAVHCAAVEPFESTWRRIHTRETRTPENIRFYSNYLDGVYILTKSRVADALTGQALQTIDFPRIVNMAWSDGVRIFVEHGPRNSLTGAIGEILGDKPHLAVALDHSAVPSMTQLYRATASLWCAGVGIDLSNINLRQPASADSVEPMIRFALRLPAVRAQAAMLAITEEQVAIDTNVYCPPDVTAGPAAGRLIPLPPALAYSIDVPAAPPFLSVNEPASKKHSTKGQLTKEYSTIEHATKKPTEKGTIKKAKLKTVPVPLRSNGQKTAAAINATGAVSEHQLLIDAHQRMLQAHQAFLSAQMEGQRNFAETMARMQTVLLGGASSPLPSVEPPTLISREPVVTGQLPGNTAAKIDPGTAVPGAAAPGAAAPVEVAELIEELNAELPGPSFSRQQVEVLAGGKISSVFGSLFEQQDHYDVQVRMPEPPLLLCDRVMGIEGEAGSMATGTVWTETDVHQDSWYLHRGRMPPGIFIESGQADLLLISWLGIDFHNKGERAYRLLGCELVFHGELPQPGDTLKYEIKVDGHAQQGDVRLFFFHYDCHINGELRISVRNGQAGFFTKEELAESAGVLWDAASADFTPGIVVPEPIVDCRKTSFSRAEVAAYLDGDLQSCFGDEFARAHTHTRTPGSPQGQGNFLGEVTEFDPTGGPAGRGYLRIVEDIHKDDWFFDGHFKNDPCMPGTLMADACLQAMAFYMSARGHSLYRDGWRFQPVRGTNYKFICRGQALPTSDQLVYEIFIDEEIIDDQPRLFAHVLCTIDGRKAFLCERLGLQLVPDWPLSSMPELLAPIADDRPLAYIDDFPLDYRSLISCAWGKPSTAFGSGFAHYDGPLRSPRLPGPPYHFMTRIVALEGDMASMQKGGQVDAVYDISADAWYFNANASRTMPYCVLMEIALQPCGWLASYTLGRDYANSDLLFRNLDGTAVQHREVKPGDGSLKTSAHLTSISQIGELIIESFEVVCTIDDEPVFTMKTVFGFFPPDAMANQKGLTISDHEQIIFDQSSNELIKFEDKPALYFGHPTAHLPDSKLLMLDRITFLATDGGQASLGSIRGEKDVDLTEWFFKAHFFQDPVQPGSLGIEAMLQLIQALMLSQGLHEGFSKPRFEPILVAEETEWHYRGQITPDKKLITVDFQCTERVVEDGNCWIVGEARLWGDGLKIYHAPKIGLRIIEDNIKGTARLGSQFDWRGVRDYWVEQSAGEHHLVHDLGASLIHKFVHNLILRDPDEFQVRKGQPAIYLANHQVGVESFLFLGMIAAMTGIPAEAIAKKEHRDSWLGQISLLTETELKEQSTTRMLFFDRDDQGDMLRILDDFGQTVAQQPRSLLVHVDGTRATRAGQPIKTVSSVLIDLAVNHNIPIIPVRFAGGLPIQPSNERLEFPVGFGSQDYYIGSVIEPVELETLPYVDRAKYVVAAINNLGPGLDDDQPLSADPGFAELVENQPDDRSDTQRVLWAALQTLPEVGARMQRLIDRLNSGSVPGVKESGLPTPAEKILAKLIGKHFGK
ncbi:MAG TPA: beta keto-acyl synthase [Gammaproteobacteria bacterium]|nr:beta keto-acyl synthase [Gammaproteobacteria bacterium]HIL97738.1 beta keto-acyl synthase [Pseudomonadales bacterium]